MNDEQVFWQNTNIQQSFQNNSYTNSYTKKLFSLSNMKYCISFRGPKLWNYFLQNQEKEI